MTRTPVVAVGASAGGVEALSAMAANLPDDAPYAVAVVLHVPAGVPSALATILERSGPLHAVTATEGMPLEPGTIVVGPPDHHLLVDGGRFLVRQGPTENRHRPSINALFRSVALHAGPWGIGVLLSGALDDGVEGLRAIRARGGRVIVQDPLDAAVPFLPTHAIERVGVDQIVTAADIGRYLTQLIDRTAPEVSMERDHRLEAENRIAMGSALDLSSRSRDLGPPSGFVCPDCHGALMEVDHHNFRCRIGHAWTANALLDMRSDEINTAVGIAVRTLEEKAELAQTLADRVSAGSMRTRYSHTAQEARRAAEVLRGHLENIAAIRKD